MRILNPKKGTKRLLLWNHQRQQRVQEQLTLCSQPQRLPRHHRRVLHLTLT